MIRRIISLIALASYRSPCSLAAVRGYIHRALRRRESRYSRSDRPHLASATNIIHKYPLRLRILTAELDHI